MCEGGADFLNCFLGYTGKRLERQCPQYRIFPPEEVSAWPAFSVGHGLRAPPPAVTDFTSFSLSRDWLPLTVPSLSPEHRGHSLCSLDCPSQGSCWLLSETHTAGTVISPCPCPVHTLRNCLCKVSTVKKPPSPALALHCSHPHLREVLWTQQAVTSGLS